MYVLGVDAVAESSVDLTLVWCDSCGREVLPYIDYAAQQESLCCVHCDGALGGGFRVVTGKELDENGYSFVEEGGCGNPDCGNGRCSR